MRVLDILKIEEPQQGDTFDIEISESEMITTGIVDIVEDGIVIHADEYLFGLLANTGLLEDIRVPVKQKPRQGPLRPQTGGGAHRDKKKEQKQGKEKHKGKPLGEGSEYEVKQNLIKHIMDMDPNMELNYLEMATIDELKEILGKMSDSVGEASNQRDKRNPTRDHLRRYPVPQDQMARPVKKKPDQGAAEGSMSAVSSLVANKNQAATEINDAIISLNNLKGRLSHRDHQPKAQEIYKTLHLTTRYMNMYLLPLMALQRKAIQTGVGEFSSKGSGVKGVHQDEISRFRKELQQTPQQFLAKLTQLRDQYQAGSSDPQLGDYLENAVYVLQDYLQPMIKNVDDEALRKVMQSGGVGEGNAAFGDRGQPGLHRDVSRDTLDPKYAAMTRFTPADRIKRRLGHDEYGDIRARQGAPRSLDYSKKPNLPEQGVAEGFASSEQEAKVRARLRQLQDIDPDNVYKIVAHEFGMSEEELRAALHDESPVGEAEYQGRNVPLGKPMAGDVKKSKVYVKGPKGNVVKVNFGAKKMRIKKSNPNRRKSFRARHNCDNPGPRWKARYWSCRAW